MVDPGSRATRFLLVAGILCLSAGCDRTFRCETDEACLRNGVTGFCSEGGGCFFDDAGCASGFAWDETSPFRSLSTRCAQTEDLGFGSPAALAALGESVGYDPARALPQRVGPLVVVDRLGSGNTVGISSPGYLLQHAPGQQGLFVVTDDVVRVGSLVTLNLDTIRTEPFLFSPIAATNRSSPEVAFDGVSDIDILEPTVRLAQFTVPLSSARGAVVDVTVEETDVALSDGWTYLSGGLTGLRLNNALVATHFLAGSRLAWESLRDEGAAFFLGCNISLDHGSSIPIQNHRDDFPSDFRGVFLGAGAAARLDNCPPEEPASELVFTELAVFENTVTPYIELRNRTSEPVSLDGCLMEVALTVGGPGIAELREFLIQDVTAPAGGFVVFAPRAGLEPDLLNWLSAAERDAVVFVSTQGIIGVGAPPFRDQAGLTLTCNGELKDRVLLWNQSRENFAQPLGLNPDDIADDNREGFRWCAQTTNFFGSQLGTPGARNDPCL